MVIMHTPITDESKFWQIAPAADLIFKYIDENSEISRSPWGFDNGNYSEDLSSVWASFSCVAVSGWGKDKLSISANKNSDGQWIMSHRVSRAV